MKDDHRVRPGTKVRLGHHDPDDTGGYEKEKAEKEIAADIERLAVLQERLYAEHRRSLLVVLQALDTGGKDGTVKHVFTGVNPTGCHVTSFKQPTAEEADHDFLWRCHRAAPPRGTIGIFNRSHYEDVLVVRVHKLVSIATCKQRYAHINAFESLLASSGTVVLKFFLHISKGEQRKRLEARIRDPEKNWKYEAGDLKERALWPSYERAYEDALGACSTDEAPWFIVPANKKWYRNLVVARVIVRTLEKMDPRPPAGTLDPKRIKLK